MDDENGRHSLVNFNATNTDMTGNIVVDDQNTANVSLFTSRLTGQTVNATNVSLDANSLWNVTANSTISQMLSNDGTIAFQHDTNGNFKTLNTQNYSTNNGTLHFNTVLGDDSSLTDRLTVSGDTTGTGNVKITNADGQGGQTIEGIKLIQVDGQSNALFSITDGDTVYNGQQIMVAGAYIYGLYQGGVSTPNDGNWYLRSVKNTNEPNNPEEPSIFPKPVYQPGVPIYEAYPQTLMALNNLPTLQQRVGNRSWLDTNSNASTPLSSVVNSAFASDTTGFWTRMEGEHNKVNPRHSTTNTQFDQNIFRIQTGVDARLIETANNALIAGINVQYSRGTANSDWHWSNSDGYGYGKITTNGYGFGGTLTWYNDQGFYIDGQTQLTWFDSDIQSNVVRKNLVNGNQGFGYAISAETGKKFDIGNDLSLTPQAQLIYSNVDFKTFKDRFNTKVSLVSADSLQARLGLSLQQDKTWKDDKGMTQRRFMYAMANMYYEFLDGTQVDVADLRLTSQLDRLSGGLGVGGSYNRANDKYSIYGEASVNTSLQNLGDSYSVKANIGFRNKF